MPFNNLINIQKYTTNNDKYVCMQVDIYFLTDYTIKKTKKLSCEELNTFVCEGKRRFPKSFSSGALLSIVHLITNYKEEYLTQNLKRLKCNSRETKS